MTVQNYAYYDINTGLIENIICIDEEVANSLVWPEGYSIVMLPAEGVAGEYSMCGIGWSYIDGSFIEPPYPAE